jgi:hypothetical protein
MQFAGASLVNPRCGEQGQGAQTMMDWYYMRQGYALLATDEETGHWFGGEAYHTGAKCSKCKSPLLLLSDIDCQKLRGTEKAKLFHVIDRLPLYYCWRCEGTELSYAIVNSKQIEILKQKGKKGPSDFPYEKYPRAFRRQPISVLPIDYNLAKLLSLCQEVGFDWLSEQDKQLIKDRMKELRHSGFSTNDFNRHQFGGVVRLIQPHTRIGCPNPACKMHKLFFEDGSTGYHMKELAVLFNDPISGLPMMESLENLYNPPKFNEWVQVVFWICEECLAITAANRCD